MSEAKRKKYKTFSLHRGGQYGATVARDLDLERWLDREMRTAHVAMVDPNGHAPSGAFAMIAGDVQHPWRPEGRRMLEAVLSDVDEDRLSEMPFVWVRYIERCRELKRQGLLTIRVVSYKKAA